MASFTSVPRLYTGVMTLKRRLFFESLEPIGSLSSSSNQQLAHRLGNRLLSLSKVSVNGRAKESQHWNGRQLKDTVVESLDAHEP